MTGWDWAMAHPWLAAVLAFVAIESAAQIANRVIRHLNIRARGYPTAACMDADGDIVHPKEGA